MKPVDALAADEPSPDAMGAAIGVRSSAMIPSFGGHVAGWLPFIVRVGTAV